MTAFSEALFVQLQSAMKFRPLIGVDIAARSLLIAGGMNAALSVPAFAKRTEISIGARGASGPDTGHPECRRKHRDTKRRGGEMSCVHVLSANAFRLVCEAVDRICLGHVVGTAGIGLVRFLESVSWILI